MFNNHNIGLPQPTRYPGYVPDRPGDDCCSCCRTFCIAFTFTGFVSCLISALYFLWLVDTSYFPFFLLCATICLAVMIHLITQEHPIPPRSLTLDQIIARRSNIPSNTLSLPAYIVVPPSERGELESSDASTESTLSAEENREIMDVEAAGSSRKTDAQPLDAEENRERMDVEAAGSSRKTDARPLDAEENRKRMDVEAADSSLKTDMQPLDAEENRERMDVEAAGSSLKTDMQPLDAEELKEATETVLKVVDETLQGIGCAEIINEGLAARLADGARRLVLEGVRQRRQVTAQVTSKECPPIGDEKAE